MRTTMRWVWTAVVGGVLLCGCSLTQSKPEVHHYLLALTIPHTLLPTTKATLVVRPFSASEPYTQDRLVYRTSPYQLDFYNYHRWAAPPAEQVTTWSRQYLRSSKIFTKVYPTGEGMADFALGGRILQFDEIDNEQSWDATLSIDFWLTGLEQRKPLWSQSYTATQKTEKRNPAAVAAAMSRNLEVILGKLVADLASIVIVPPTP